MNICSPIFFPWPQILGRQEDSSFLSDRKHSLISPVKTKTAIDYSFANEYKGPLIANLPRADPVEIDQIPTALPVSFSSLSRGVSYPVVQPLVRTNKVTKKKKKKNGLVGDSAACPSVVLKPHHVVSGWSSSSSKRLELDVAAEEEEKSSVCLPLSSSSSAEVREITLDEGNENRVRFLVPSQDSECDESSYFYDGESVAAPTPRAERKGKKGSCYRCLMGNRFTEKEVCIVCHAKYCCYCVRRAMGAMPEGRKCVTCIGHTIDESNRGSLGKCSRMLKRVLTDSELKKVMSDEISCRANQMPSRLIAVNGKPLDEDELFMLQTCPNPPKKLKPGDYWYDKVAGYWGKVGEKPCKIISPNMSIGGTIRKDASNGDTEICINGREITKTELIILKMVGVQCEGKPHFWVDAEGSYQEEGQNRLMGNIWKKKRAKLAYAVFSLPIPPTSSAVEPNVEPISQKNMLNKLLLVGNDTSGATTIYKQVSFCIF
ncbi:hypothetical protein Bca4012_025404 [Brassica carinata]